MSTYEIYFTAPPKMSSGNGETTLTMEVDSQFVSCGGMECVVGVDSDDYLVFGELRNDERVVPAAIIDKENFIAAVKQ